MTALVLALLTQAPVEPLESERPLITSVEVRLPAGADVKLLDRVPQLISVRKGQALSPRAVSRTIEALFATGRFADIEVLAREVEDGVEVMVVLTPRQNIGSLFLEGNRALPREEVLAVTRLEAGTEYWPERLERAADDIRTLYFRRGFRDATVRTEAVVVEGVLTCGFVVEEGVPSTVTAVAFTGEPGLPTWRLTQAFGLAPGAVLDLTRADEGVEQLRALLRRQGYFRARVDAPLVSDGGRVVVPVVAGPKYRVVFHGNRAMSDASLTALLGWNSDEPLDVSLAARLAQRIERFYRFRGFHDVRVQAREALMPGTRDAALAFVIEEGAPLRVTELTFDGAKAISPGELREVLRRVVENAAPVVSLDVHATSDLSDSAGRTSAPFAPVLPQPPGDTVLVEEAWAEAPKTLAALYRERGYLRAQVAFAGAELSGGTASARFVIQEGQQARYREVRAEGLPEGFRSDAVASLRRGAVLSVAEVRNLERDLTRELGRKGYLYSSVESSYALDESGTHADVVFEVATGPQVHVRTVIAVGHVRTVEEVILRQATMREGEVLDQESLYSTQARLQALNIFRTVQVELLSPERPEAEKTIIIRVKERPFATLDPSFGYFFADGLRVALEGSLPNIGGRAITLTGRGQLNLFFFSYPALSRIIDLSDLELWEQLGGRLNASLDAPALLPLDIGVRLDAVLERVFRPQFRFTRVAGGPTINWSHAFDVPRVDWLKPRLSLALQYEVEWSLVESVGNALTAIPPTSLVDQERLRFLFGQYALHSVRFSPALDLRDNALVPHKGALLQASAEVTGALAARDEAGNPVTVNFFKLSGQLTGYVPFGDRVVLALSVRGGRIFPLQSGSTTPPVRRFFLGGAPACAASMKIS